MERKGIIGWWECKLAQKLLKPVWKVPKILKIEYHVIQQFHIYLGVYPEELKLGSQRDICTSMIIAVLFKITKT